VLLCVTAAAAALVATGLTRLPVLAIGSLVSDAAASASRVVVVPRRRFEIGRAGVGETGVDAGRMLDIPAPTARGYVIVVANKSTNVEGVGLDTVLQIAKLLHPARFPS
jgi:hypothetical protein